MDEQVGSDKKNTGTLMSDAVYAVDKKDGAPGLLGILSQTTWYQNGF